MHIGWISSWVKKLGQLVEEYPVQIANNTIVNREWLEKRSSFLEVTKGYELR
jgi:hypothetical protein